MGVSGFGDSYCSFVYLNLWENHAKSKSSANQLERTRKIPSLYYPSCRPGSGNGRSLVYRLLSRRSLRGRVWNFLWRENMDLLNAEDRLARLDNHWLDWWEGWFLRYRHFRAWNEWVRHIRETEYHRELAGEALHEAQFWRNRQLERGKDVSYNPAELNVWLDWVLGGFVVLVSSCLVIGLILGWVFK